MTGIGKLVGRVLGEAVAAPATIAAELVDAAEETIEAAAQALDRAGRKIAGDDERDRGDG